MKAVRPRVRGPGAIRTRLRAVAAAMPDSVEEAPAVPSLRAAASVPVAVLARVVGRGSPAPVWGTGARVREGGGHLPSM